MRFRVERNEFTDAVSWTARTLPQRPTGQLQVLSGLMLATTDDGVRLSAFDYEVAAEGTVPAAVADPGSALVPGRLLAEITRALPAAPIDVEADANRLVLTCGSTRFTLPLLPVEDYPDLPAMPDEVGRIEGAAFAAAVGQVVVAAGRDETLPVLTGVRMEITGERLVLAATDRYRLAVREIPWRPLDTAASGAALIPSRTLNETAKALGAAGAEVVIALAASAALPAVAAGPAQAPPAIPWQGLPAGRGGPRPASSRASSPTIAACCRLVARWRRASRAPPSPRQSNACVWSRPARPRCGCGCPRARWCSKRAASRRRRPARRCPSTTAGLT